MGTLKALETGFFFHRGPVLENLEGVSFTRDIERRTKEGSRDI
jgi:hypothetical protein